VNRRNAHFVTIYPVGSIHRYHDNLWEELPREDRGIVEIGPPQLFIGMFWAFVIELGLAAICWLAVHLWRVL
jgi:hypothetical protein